MTDQLDPTIYESDVETGETRRFSLSDQNGKRKSRLGRHKRKRIYCALKHGDVDVVYMKNGDLYRTLLNGTTGRLDEEDHYGLTKRERRGDFSRSHT